MEEATRVMIVDDDLRIRSVFATGLKHYGYEVQAVASAKEAVQQFEAFGADVVITDMLMPGANGAALINHLRGQNAAVKIMLISGGGSQPADDCLSLGSRYGADVTLQKPLRIEQLDAEIKALLG